MGEIDLRIEGLTSNSKADEDADKLTDLPIEPPVTREGDLWLLGEHRVYCGSALDPGAFDTVMGGEKAAAVFSDPPYNVKIDGNCQWASARCGTAISRWRPAR